MTLTAGNQVIGALGKDAESARVTPPLVTIPPHIQTWARSKLPAKMDLEDWTGGSAEIQIEKSENPHNLKLFGITGLVEQHIDGAVRTLGLVLMTKGAKRLQVGKHKWPLEVGAIFHIDSDRDHGTIAEDDSELVFVCFDFLHSDRLPEGFAYNDAAQIMLTGIDDLMTERDF